MLTVLHARCRAMRCIPSSRRILSVFLAALAALLLLPGCEKTPQDHAEIAVNPRENFEKRMASVQALVTLGDQALLADVIKSTGDPKIASAAMQKITDPQLLAGIALGAGLWEVRLDVALATNNQPALADIVKKYTEDSIAIEAGAVHRDVRAEAMVKLTDQAILASLAQDAAANARVREAAIGKLTDQALLLTIVRDTKNSREIRAAAARALTDPEAMFVEIVGTAEMGSKWDNDKEQHYLAEQVLERITDQARLAAFVRGDYMTSEHNYSIIAKLTDPKLIEEFAVNHPDSVIRLAAVKKLTDAQVLARIAKTDQNEDVSKEAVSKIPADAQALLHDVVKNAQATWADAKALKKLTDEQLLADVAKTTTSRTIREDAMDKITDQAVLADLARHNGTDAAPVRLLALWRLADKALLADIAKNDTDELVRKAAAAKLSDAPATGASATKNIADLIKEGMVIAKIRGNSDRRLGASKLDINVKRMTPHPLEIVIPIGTYFACDNDNEARSMIALKDVHIKLEQDTQSAVISTAFAYRPRKAPTEDDGFTIGIIKEAEDMSKLTATLARKEVPYYTQQAAIWIVTGADYSDLDPLRIVSQNDISIPGVVSGSRAINEPETAEAMQIIAESGIDIKKKAIWQDCSKILAGLKAGELKNWLKKFSGLTASAHKEGVFM